MIVNCSTSKTCFEERNLIHGVWISKLDNNWRLTFTENYMIDEYIGDYKENYEYSLSALSCDKQYTEQEGLLFLKLSSGETPNCYEITSLNKNHLVYRETNSGHLQEFLKLSISN